MPKPTIYQSHLGWQIGIIATVASTYNASWTVYRYFWAYPFLLFLFSTFQFLIPCGRLSRLMSAFECKLKYHIISYCIVPSQKIQFVIFWIPGRQCEKCHSRLFTKNAPNSGKARSINQTLVDNKYERQNNRHISQPTTLNVSLTDVMQKPLAVTTDASQYEYMIMEAKQQCYE